MSTEKPRFSITLDAELYEKVNEYQHAKKYATQTKAIVDLITRGAKSLGLVQGDAPAIRDTTTHITLTEEEYNLVMAYREADQRARQMVDLALEPWSPPAYGEEAM